MPSYENFSWRRTSAMVATSRTDDIWFLDAATGWAVNSDGRVLRTTDGGDSWTVQAELPDTYLRCIGFAGADRGWIGAITPQRRLFRTTDGGTSWQLVNNLPAGAPPSICGISVVDAMTVYASGTNFPNRPCAIVKTTDGGATWTAIDMSAHAAILVDILFVSPTEGWVVGGRDDVGRTTPQRRRNDVKPVILHTTDGGATWIDRLRSIDNQLPRGEWGWKIQRLDGATMLVALENFLDGAIARSDDGGQSWRRLRINDRQRNSNLEGIGFLDRDRGWVGGWGDFSSTGGYSSATTDGGGNWDNANEIGFRLNRFRFIGQPPTVAYASGDTVYKFTDAPPPAAHAAAATAARAAMRNEPRSSTSVAVEFSVPPGAGRLSINVWDRFGEHVAVLAEEAPPVGGPRRIDWGFTDSAGAALPAGPYVVRITIDGRSGGRMVHKSS